jgi:tRNA A37 threonylcarbamoyladenosine dehydratase
MKNTDWLERTELLLKEEGVKNLNKANVLVVGLGGVGSYAAEFMARVGIGKMTIIDGDEVDETNINRQLVALTTTIGQSKCDIMSQRIHQINPEIELTVVNEFLNPERMDEVVAGGFDYVLDCIDSIRPKVTLIKVCSRRKIKLVSSMGAGGKLDPTKLEITNINKTYNCKMARYVRKQLKKDGVNRKFKAVFSSEVQDEASLKLTDGSNFKKSFYGTISYMPALFGCAVASVAIRYIAEGKAKK